MEIHTINLIALEAWMDAQGLGRGPIEQPTALAGGTQNVLLRFTRDGREYVLRRPPLHKRANSDETMRREARVLAALEHTDVPHPSLIAACADADVLGAAFYLMEPVAGFNPSTELPYPHRTEPELQLRMGLSMAESIAALGRVDFLAAGLADLGKPDGWLERQIERWRSHLGSYEQMEGYRGVALPGVEAVAAWLAERQPRSWSPGLIHGDFHFSNVLIRHDDGEVAAIVDWELATLGDPLLDLGHLLATWPTRGVVAPELARLALPSTDEVVSRYSDGSVRDVSLRNVLWYQVFACYRLGIILEGTNARADTGQAPRETGDLLHANAVSLFEQALEVIGG